MQILGIPGSLRAGSYNRRLLQLAGEHLPDGVELAVWEGLRDLPAFDEDEEANAPFPVGAFRTSVRDADAVLVVTPEYNGSIPGALKNALDWGSRPRETAAFRGKPVAVIGASTGSFGGVWAQAEAKKVLGLMGARIVDADLSIGKAKDRLEEPDEEIAQGLRRVLDVLIEQAAARPVAA